MRSKFVCTALMASVVIFSSCKKDKPEDTVALQSTVLSAKVDGVSFQSKDALASQSKDSQIFTLGAKDDKGNNIVLTANGTVGVHDDASDPDAGGIYSDANGAVYMTSGNGGSIHINITKYDLSTKKMSGTFSFVGTAIGGNATGTRTITEGTFTDVTIVVH